MTLLLLEALGALLLLVFIVWWTMFAGRKRGEPRDANLPSAPTEAPIPADPARDPHRPAEPMR